MSTESMEEEDPRDKDGSRVMGCWENLGVDDALIYAYMCVYAYAQQNTTIQITQTKRYTKNESFLKRGARKSYHGQPWPQPGPLWGAPHLEMQRRASANNPPFHKLHSVSTQNTHGRPSHCPQTRCPGTAATDARTPSPSSFPGQPGLHGPPVLEMGVHQRVPGNTTAHNVHCH